MSVTRCVQRRIEAVGFSAAVKPFAMLPAGRPPSGFALRCLQWGWGNPGYSAGARYLRHVSERAVAASGPVLECGSGLTTVVLGLLARRNGFDVVTLEHDPNWHARITETLARLGLDRVRVHLAPLQRYGTFDWYDVSDLPDTQDFDLVVCDGPPGKTRGGRVGLMPLMGDRLADDAVILLDDTRRKRERRAIDLWRRRRPLTVRPMGRTGRCAEIRLGPRAKQVAV